MIPRDETGRTPLRLMHADKTRAAPRIMPADAAGIDEAARLLRAGALVAFATETVYGLGADATDAEAVARIFAVKGRPRFNPLIAHLAAPGEAERHARMDAAARRLAEAFWPGPLTLVLPAAEGTPVSPLARAGLASIALRVPAHPVARALLSATGRPVAAPSANRSGRISPTRAAHVAGDLGADVALVLDAGPTGIGVESTIVACLGNAPALLRPGGLPREAIETVLGRPLATREGKAAPLAPGMLASHYAPSAAVRLGAADLRPGEALLGFGPVPFATGDAPVVNLSESGDLVEAAARLFDALHQLDASGARTIAVMPVPEEGLGLAINDRLARAAAPR